jgi:hypothetical protein
MVFNISYVYPTVKEGCLHGLRSPKSQGLGYFGENPSMSMGAWRFSIILDMQCKIYSISNIFNITN